MVSLSIALYLSTVVSGVAFAKPMLSTRQTTICTPTFNSVKPYIWSNSEPVGLSDGVKSGSGLLKAFGPGSLFKFTKVDSSSPSFYIQPFEDQNLAVALRPNSSLFLRENENEKNTRFIIECTECKEAINDNCFMKMANNPNTCVQIGNDPGGWRGAAGDPVFVASECKKQDKQRFNYFPRDVPIKPPASPPTTPPTNPPEQKVCNPNFEFEGVRVANSAQYWGAPKFEDNVDLVGEGDFNKRLEIRFEQTGSPQAHYVAKSLNGTNLAVGVRESNGNLYFVKDADLNKDKYKFSIECKAFCKGASSVAPGDLPADGCTIKSLVGNRCVQLGNGPSAGNQGDRLFVRDCDGTDSQRWNFLTSPFKTTGRPVSIGGSNTKTNVAAAVGGDSDSVNLDVKTLITNSYVVIGLLAGILTALVSIAVISTRGCFKGRSSKPKYTYVDASGKEIEALTLPSGRYSD